MGWGLEEVVVVDEAGPDVDFDFINIPKQISGHLRLGSAINGNWLRRRKRWVVSIGAVNNIRPCPNESVLSASVATAEAKP